MPAEPGGSPWPAQYHAAMSSGPCPGAVLRSGTVDDRRIEDRGRRQSATRHGYDASVNESLGAPDDRPSSPQPARSGDSGLETTLLAFADLAYRDAFWPQRRYEDACDRIALRAFLPRAGGRLIEVGAGFGRLVDEYAGYREVVLLDPSRLS